MAAENEMTIGELWALIDRGNRDTRKAIQQDLDDVRNRLDSYITKDQFTAEKALLEIRIERAERELQMLDAKHVALAERVAAEREAEQRRRAEELDQREQQRQARAANFRSNVIYKVAVPTLLLLLPALMALWSPLK